MGDWSIFLGEASPLYPKEVPSQTGFFWREDGDMHFNHGGKFKKGWFGMRSAKSIIDSPANETVRFAGVTNQFFTTVIKPEQPSTTTVWGKSRQVEIQEGTGSTGSEPAQGTEGYQNIFAPSNLKSQTGSQD